MGQRSLRIIAIDDREVFRLQYQRVFDELGHQATILSDPDRLLDYLSEQQYDVLVLDLHLKRANGLDLLAEAKASIADGRRLPEVIVVTGDESPETARRAAHDGVRYFVTKAMAAESLPCIVKHIAENAA